MTYHVERQDPIMKEVIANCFPSYHGKRIRLSTSVPSRISQYWDGGSKRTYVFYQLGTKKAYAVEDNHPFFEKDKPRDLNSLPSGVVLVEHSIFCGKDMGITIYANHDDLAPMLPDKTTELPFNLKAVLFYTKSLKNSYGGETDIRFRTANRAHGITRQEWMEAMKACIASGWLNRAGAITASGRNMIGDIYHLEK
jgi:hypothetical protein